MVSLSDTKLHRNISPNKQFHLADMRPRPQVRTRVALVTSSTRGLLYENGLQCGGNVNNVTQPARTFTVILYTSTPLHYIYFIDKNIHVTYDGFLQYDALLNYPTYINNNKEIMQYNTYKSNLLHYCI